MQGLRVYEQSGSRFFSSPVEVVFNFHPHVSFFPLDQISVDEYLEWGGSWLVLGNLPASGVLFHLLADYRR